MNCLFLVLLLLFCGNDGGSGCGCFGSRNMAGREGRRDGQGRDRDRDRDRNEGCGCNDRGRDRNDGNGRRNDDGPESRFESRGFIPYPGSSCGNDEPENRGGCNCAD